MSTWIHVDPSADAASALAAAAEAVRRGALVIFPTETVYGIAARADDPAALQALYAAKGRPPEKPCAYHIGDWEIFAQLAGPQPPDILALLRRSWPGPVTFLLRVKDETRGFRFPSHAIGQQFLHLCGVPVFGTSANRSGAPSPCDAEATREVAPYAAYVIDAGPTPLRGDSTVVDLTQDPPVCVRRGVAPWPPADCSSPSSAAVK
ncbi:MAG: L-threonylcarbamoyladenylate synthase [bacterium]|nr:L-threonylcarbamoyladenylate synthase [bacterium]